MTAKVLKTAGLLALLMLLALHLKVRRKIRVFWNSHNSGSNKQSLQSSLASSNASNLARFSEVCAFPTQWHPAHPGVVPSRRGDCPGKVSLSCHAFSFDSARLLVPTRAENPVEENLGPSLALSSPCDAPCGVSQPRWQEDAHPYWNCEPVSQCEKANHWLATSNKEVSAVWAAAPCRVPTVCSRSRFLRCGAEKNFHRTHGHTRC